MKSITLLTFVLLYVSICEIHAACKGSVTFYWKEDPKARDENSRNWGELEEEKKFVGSKSRLSTFFDTDRAYAFKVDGTCCWEMFSEKAFKESFYINHNVQQSWFSLDNCASQRVKFQCVNKWSSLQRICNISLEGNGRFTKRRIEKLDHIEDRDEE